MEREIKNQEKTSKDKKRFWEKVIEKLDKKMEEKANSRSCCGSDAKGGKCC